MLLSRFVANYYDHNLSLSPFLLRRYSAIIYHVTTSPRDVILLLTTLEKLRFILFSGSSFYSVTKFSKTDRYAVFVAIANSNFFKVSILSFILKSTCRQTKKINVISYFVTVYLSSQKLNSSNSDNRIFGLVKANYCMFDKMRSLISDYF